MRFPREYGKRGRVALTALEYHERRTENIFSLPSGTGAAVVDKTKRPKAKSAGKYWDDILLEFKWSLVVVLYGGRLRVR